MRPPKRKPSRVYLLTTDGNGNLLPLTGELIDTNTHGPLVVFEYKAGLRCELCDGTGIVCVPHPGGRPDGGLWPVLRPPADDPTGINRDLAVTCTCTVGQRTVDGEQGRGRNPLTFLAYTRRYPNYAEVDYLRHEIRRAASTEPTAADYQNLAAALAARAKLPRRTAWLT